MWLIQPLKKVASGLKCFFEKDNCYFYFVLTEHNVVINGDKVMVNDMGYISLNKRVVVLIIIGRVTPVAANFCIHNLWILVMYIDITAGCSVLSDNCMFR